MSKTTPNLPLKVRLLLSAHVFSVDAARRSNLTVNRGLVKVFDPKSPPSSKPINDVSSFDVTINSDTKLWLRLYNPTTTTSTSATSPGDGVNDDVSLPVVVYFHGGGFSFMGANSKNYDGLCRRLAREIPAVVLSVNYRLAPEHRCPSQYEDGFEALKFLESMDFGSFKANVDLSRCFIAGDSAGGNLAHHVALKAAGEYSFEKVKIVGLIAIQPFFGGEEETESEKRIKGGSLITEERTEWMWKAFLPDGSDRNHPSVNVFGPNAVDISGAVGFPSTLLIIGGFDPLQDWQRKYHQGLKKSGKEVDLIEYPNAIHAFYCFPDLPESALLITEIKNFMHKQLSKNST
ncbi:hypothetical protein HS088_TW22G00775 [Tripterygium wilfordii]|uniref:Alpha/beta hydrolase fold-3 domain-containing protein n=1 Tax=Tripterygium wilfordii TaxID=458696 RepID=A0A7J7BZ28_TRIWF|nr:probable carboxylesterase 18 [Tripterygium wilfordii]KAF5727088.1 hypothetical protein HS088_TW22G00775 [Tripterygium wilfordii]